MKNLNRTVVIVCICLLMFTSCISTKRTTNERKNNSSVIGIKKSGIKVNAFSLGIGDVFEIKVYGENELSGIYRINSDGYINFPFVGKLYVIGITSSELEDLLSEKLSKGYLNNPHVNIDIKEYNSKKIYIFGEINKPGTINYEENMNMIKAIIAAGGFTKSAAKDRISITRNENNIEKRIYVSVDFNKGSENEFYLMPGDIIFIPESLF